MRAFITLILVVALPLQAAAQQQNSTSSALSINGTGRVDSMGAAIPSQSMVSPPPAGSAPIYHHRTSPGASLELRVDGPPALPFLLLAGSPAAAPIPIGPDLLEIDLNGIQLLLNGSQPMNLFDYGAFTGFDGVGQLFNTIGLPPGFGPLTLQAIIVDPAAAPFGFRLTASVTLEVEGSLETLARNFTDGLNESLSNPLYLQSLCSTSFKQDGLSAAQLVAYEAAVRAGIIPDESAGVAVFEQIGPDPINAPALPTGLPTPGQNLAIHYQIAETSPDPLCGTTPVTIGERHREQRIQVIEQGGIWKVHGNQEDVLVEAEINYQAGPTNPSGVDVGLFFFVEDSLGQRGGIAGVTISGPQLASLDGFARATSSASGTRSMTLDDGGGGGPSCWFFEVYLAVASAGSSRLPLVETAAGPRDTYQVTVTWNDATTSGPYSYVLRSGIDVNANPAGVLAAIPATTGVSGTLFNGGTSSASVNLTFPVGNLPASLFGSLAVGLFQLPLGYEFEGLFSPFTPGTTTTLNLCTPFLAPGTTFYGAFVRDIHGASYTGGNVLNL